MNGLFMILLLMLLSMMSWAGAPDALVSQARTHGDHLKAFEPVVTNNRVVWQRGDRRCFKNCGAGSFVRGYHRECNGMPNECHVTLCSISTCGGDRFNDLCQGIHFCGFLL